MGLESRHALGQILQVFLLPVGFDLPTPEGSVRERSRVVPKVLGRSVFIDNLVVHRLPGARSRRSWRHWMRGGRVSRGWIQRRDGLRRDASRGGWTRCLRCGLALVAFIPCAGLSLGAAKDGRKSCILGEEDLLVESPLKSSVIHVSNGTQHTY